MAKVFITNYALTGGIKEVETEIIKSNLINEEYVKPKGMCSIYYIGKNAFTNKSEAIKKAEDMRKRKIASLYKQIERLKKLSFTNNGE